MIYDTTELIVDNNKVNNNHKNFEFDVIIFFNWVEFILMNLKKMTVMKLYFKHIKVHMIIKEKIKIKY